MRCRSCRGGGPWICLAVIGISCVRAREAVIEGLGRVLKMGIGTEVMHAVSIEEEADFGGLSLWGEERVELWKRLEERRKRCGGKGLVEKTLFAALRFSCLISAAVAGTG